MSGGIKEPPEAPSGLPGQSEGFVQRPNWPPGSLGCTAPYEGNLHYLLREMGETSLGNFAENGKSDFTHFVPYCQPKTTDSLVHHWRPN